MSQETSAAAMTKSVRQGYLAKDPPTWRVVRIANDDENFEKCPHRFLVQERVQILWGWLPDRWVTRSWHYTERYAKDLLTERREQRRRLAEVERARQSPPVVVHEE